MAPNSQKIEWVSYFRKNRVPIFVSAMCNVGYAIFTLFSIPLLIPFFKLLFGIEDNQQALTNPVEKIFIGYFDSIIQQSGAQQALIMVCVAFIGAILIRNIMRYFSLYVMSEVRNNVIADVRTNLYKSIFLLPRLYMTEHRKGDLISKALIDVQEIEWSILNTVEVLFRSPLLLVGSLTLMFVINTKLTLIVFVLVIITVITLRTLGKYLKNQSSKVQNALSTLTSLYEEAITGASSIKVYQAEQNQIDRFNNYNSNLAQQATKALRIRDISAPISESLGMIIVGLLMYLGANMVFAKAMRPESFFAFLFAFYQVIEPAKALANGYAYIQKGRAAVDRVNLVMQEAASHPILAGKENLDIFRNHIEFKGVSFSYKGDDQLALKDISFKINKGEKLAFVGASGSGKTTLALLLCRLYDPTAGNILIDGIPLHNYTLQSSRKIIGWVPQESYLVHDTVYNNITLHDSSYSREQVKSALQQAHAWEFVSKLDNNMDTIIGDGGSKLSGGQRQRLSIARALLRDPDILIFDEATSALDATSESIVQESIDQISQSKTAIIIAHRLSTIKNADRIIMLAAGSVIGIGNHNELLERCPQYIQFIQDQSL